MNLFFRLIWTFLFARFRTPCDFLGPCITPFTTLPNDLDVLLHMNNGRYLTLLDLARLDLLLRSGLQQKWQKDFYPVVVGETIQFRKSFKVFQRFEVQTRVVGWDEKAFYLEQIFIRQKDIYAVAYIQARILRKKGGSASPAEVLTLIGYTKPSPSLPAWLIQWRDHQLVLRETVQI